MYISLGDSANGEGRGKSTGVTLEHIVLLRYCTFLIKKFERGGPCAQDL